MKIKHQLSIATLVMVGFFATGCSQQEAGGSQVSGGSQASGGSQQQVEGGAQVAGGSQQQQEEVVVAPAVVKQAPPAVVRQPRPAPVRRVVQQPRRVMHNPWYHHHPEAPKCAKTRSHSHKYMRTGARHHHRYSCVKPRHTRYVPRQVRRVQPQPQPQVDVRALQTKLKAKGFYRGPIDGIVGPSTRSALKRFMNR